MKKRKRLVKSFDTETNFKHSGLTSNFNFQPSSSETFQDNKILTYLKSFSPDKPPQTGNNCTNLRVIEKVWEGWIESLLSNCFWEYIMF